MFNSKKRRIRNFEVSFEEAYKTIMELGEDVKELENSVYFWKFISEQRKGFNVMYQKRVESLSSINATYKKEISDLCERLKEKELILQAIKDNGLLKTATVDRIQFDTNTDGRWIGREGEEMKNKKIMTKKGGKKPC